MTRGPGFGPSRGSTAGRRGQSADCGDGGVTGLGGVFGVCGVFGVFAVGGVLGVFGVWLVTAEPDVFAEPAVFGEADVFAVTVVIDDPFCTSVGLGVADVAGASVGVLDDVLTWTDGETVAGSGASNAPCAVATVAPRPTAPSAPVTIHALRAFMILLLRPMVRTTPRPCMF
ncbi:hypothetical protein [Cellulosimicrobium cellulans]|uniref:hypothetical protein n=1 Tax=Cellulosimicrobium cellulans TaxID=1710 RepID=UPI001141A523|nr:hypothetical protein [Cellulosimicrobium cellulans]